MCSNASVFLFGAPILEVGHSLAAITAQETLRRWSLLHQRSKALQGNISARVCMTRSFCAPMRILASTMPRYFLPMFWPEQPPAGRDTALPPLRIGYYYRGGLRHDHPCLSTVRAARSGGCGVAKSLLALVPSVLLLPIPSVGPAGKI